jgi:hypothetical protein
MAGLIALAAVLGFPLLTILVLVVGVLFGSDTPRNPADGWCLTLKPPHRRAAEKEEDEP